MRKSILIGALAALMLFAFTACQDPIDVNGYVPTMVTVEQNGVIVEGQAVTADSFTATVTYANGKTNAVDGIVSFENAQQPATGLIAKAIVKGANGATIEATTPVVITDVTSVAISGEAQTIEVGKSVNYAALTVIGTYAGGTYTYTATDDLSVSAADSNNIPSAITTAPYAVKASDLKLTGVTATISSVDFSVSVVEATVEHKAIKSISAVALADSTAKVCYGDSVLNKSLYKVTGSDGEKTWTLDESEFNVLIAGGTDNGGLINTTTGSSVKVYIQSTADNTISKDFSFTAITDPVVAVRVINSTSKAVVTSFPTEAALERYSTTQIPTGYTVQTLKASEQANGAEAAWTDLSSGYKFSTPVLNASGTSQQVVLSVESDNGETYSVNLTFSIKDPATV